MPNLKTQVFHLFLITGLYLLAAVIITYPLVTTLNRSLIYYPQELEGNDPTVSDVIFHYWNLWWFKKSLYDLRASPLFSNYVYYPQGLNLVPSLEGYTIYFLGLVFLNFFNLITSFNLLVIFNFVFTGLAAYFLANYFLKDRLGSFFAGLYTLVSSYMVYRALQHLALQNPGFSILFLLFYFKYLGNTGTKNYVSCLFFLVLSGLTSWNLTFLAASVPLFYPLLVFLENGAGSKMLVRLYTRTAQLLLIPLLTGFFVLFRAHQNGLLYIYSPLNSVSWSNDLVGFMLPLRDTLIYNPWHLLVSVIYKGIPYELSENRSFIGLTGLIPLIYFLKKSSLLSKKVILALIVALYLFSLGPFVHIFGTPTLIPGLYWILLGLNPFLSIMRSPGRFSIFFIVFLSITVGWAASNIIQKKLSNNLVRLSVGLLFFGLIILDQLVYPVKTYEIKSNAFYDSLRKNGRDEVVFDLPLYKGDDMLNKRFLLAQTLHEKRILNGPRTTINKSKDSLLPELRYSLLTCGNNSEENQTVEDVQKQLVEDRVNYLVLHKDLFCPSVEPVLEKIERGSQNVYEDRDIKVLTVSR